MKNKKNWEIFNIASEMTKSSVDQLMEFFKSSLSKGNLFVALNMERTNFIDSLSLGLLVKMQQKFSSEGGEIVFMNPNNYMLNIIEIVSLDKIFKIFYDSEQP